VLYQLSYTRDNEQAMMRWNCSESSTFSLYITASAALAKIMATIKDVAARAGVSHTTVSHVVNKTKRVSDHVRNDVEAAIRELGYVPNNVARSLKQRTTQTIGLLISNSTNPFFAELACGIEDACYRRGYSVVLCNSEDDPKREQAYLRVLLEKRVDGLIIGSTGENNTFTNQLQQLRVPLMIIDRPIPGVHSNLVQVDHEQGGYLATKHLLELGHREIGCIAGPSTAIVSLYRVAGYRRALAEAGLPYREELVVESDFTCEGGYQSAAHLLQRAEFTAVFAGNDLMGIGVLRWAKEQRISVPEQLSVIGFDDIELCRYVYPALTTVGHSIRRQGEVATATLIQSIITGSPHRQIMLEPSVFIRESTARI
jgi:LacI family transcriptional regulator, galactose operon repressor